MNDPLVCDVHHGHRARHESLRERKHLPPPHLRRFGEARPPSRLLPSSPSAGQVGLRACRRFGGGRPAFAPVTDGRPGALILPTMFAKVSALPWTRSTLSGAITVSP